MTQIPPLPHTEVDHIIQAFKTWDESGTGLISRADLAHIIRALSPGIEDDDLDKLFNAAASDGFPGNDLKYEDFVTWLWLPSPVEEAQGPSKDASARASRTQQPSPKKAPAAPAFDPAEEERRRRGLWEAALAEAIARGSRKYSENKVRHYFSEVRTRLTGEEYVRHVKGEFFQEVDSDRDGKTTFRQVASIIGKSLKCVADIKSEQEPTMQEIKAAFDAHDTLVSGRGLMGVDEFLNLMRYLQVRIAEAAMPLSRVFQ